MLNAPQYNTTKKVKLFDGGKQGSVKFNVMVTGQPGCGKTTFLRSFPEPYIAEAIGGGFFVGASDDCFLRVEERSVDQDGGLRNYLLEKHGDFCQANKQLMTTQEQNDTDERIHCLFYFFGPHRILESDEDCLASVRDLVPVIPILARADSLTAAERQTYLHEIQDFMAELDSESHFPVHFQFPDDRNVASGTNNSDDYVGEKKVQDTVDTGTVPGDLAPPAQLDSPAVDTYEVLSYSYHSTSGSSTGAAHTHSALQGLSDDAASGQTTSTLPTVAAAGCQPAEVDCDSTAAVPRLANIFAVVCSTSESGLREYPWGASVSAYDERVSDFRRLQRLVFEQGNIARLRDITHHKTMMLHREGKLTPWSLYKWWKKAVEPDLEFYVSNILFAGVVGVYGLLWHEIWRAHLCMHAI